MTRARWVAAVVVGLAGLALTLGPSAAEEEKDPSIKEIMTKAHKGGDSLLGKLDKELKADEPEWEAVQKHTKELVKLGGALGKADPPRGEKESWEKLTKSYNENAKAMDEAAKKQDKEKSADHLKKVRGMCANCHKEHKGK